MVAKIKCSSKQATVDYDPTSIRWRAETYAESFYTLELSLCAFSAVI